MMTRCFFCNGPVPMGGMMEIGGIIVPADFMCAVREVKKNIAPRFVDIQKPTKQPKTNGE